ncbi:hypothetical protein YC2023_045147 [Brassica napus]
MSSGDLPANEVISPKIEFEVEEDAKEAYYRAHCSSPPPQQENPIPKRRLRPQGAPFMPSMMRSPSRKAGFIYSLGSGVTVAPFDDVEPVADLPAQRRNSKSRKDKGVAFEAVSGDHPLPGWDPSFTLGERGGTSAAPPPSEFFDDLPPAFTSDERRSPQVVELFSNRIAHLLGRD